MQTAYAKQLQQGMPQFRKTRPNRSTVKYQIIFLLHFCRHHVTRTVLYANFLISYRNAGNNIFLNLGNAGWGPNPRTIYPSHPMIPSQNQTFPAETPIAPAFSPKNTKNAGLLASTRCYKESLTKETIGGGKGSCFLLPANERRKKRTLL